MTRNLLISKLFFLHYLKSFTPEILKRLIDYCTIMPVEDSALIGYKYPFNACEILCSENGFNIGKIIEKLENDEREREELKRIQEEAIKKEKEDEENRKIMEEEKKKETLKDLNEEKVDEGKENEGDKQHEEEPKKQDDVQDQNQTKEQGDVDKKEPGELTEDQQENVDSTIHSHHRKKMTALEEDTVKELVISEENLTEDNKPKETIQNTPKISCEEQAIIIANDLLDHLFKFVDTPTSTDNYVLVGYFSKIVTNILVERPRLLIEYIFTKHPECRIKLIHHLNRKSIGNLIERILEYMKDNNINDSLTHKITFTKEILNELLDTTDPLSIEIICDLLASIFISPKENFVLFLTTPDLLEILSKSIEKYISNPDTSLVIYLIKLLIKINEQILKDFEKRITPSFTNQQNSELNKVIQSLDSLNFSDPIQSNLDGFESNLKETNVIKNHFQRIISIISTNNKIIFSNLVQDNNQDQQFNSTYGTNQKVLGMKRLIQWEYFVGVLDIILNGIYNKVYDDQLLNNITEYIEIKLFSKAVDSYFSFGLNNMYQNLFDMLIQMCIIESTPDIIINHLFGVEQLNFLTQLSQNIISSTKLNYSSANIINSPLFAQNIMLFDKILLSKNQRLISIIESNSTDMLIFNENVVTKVKSIFTTKLLYEDTSNKQTVTNNCERRDFDDDILEYDSDTDNKKEEIPLSVKSLREVFSQGNEMYDCHLKGIKYEEKKVDIPVDDNEAKKEAVRKEIEKTIDEEINKAVEDGINSAVEQVLHKIVDDNLNKMNYQGKLSETPVDNVIEKPVDQKYIGANYWNAPFTIDENLLESLNLS